MVPRHRLMVPLRHSVHPGGLDQEEDPGAGHPLDTLMDPLPSMDHHLGILMTLTMVILMTLTMVISMDHLMATLMDPLPLMGLLTAISMDLHPITMSLLQICQL